MTKHPDSLLIDALGGPTEVAKVFGISPQAVSIWRRGGIPRPNRMYLELARPEVFTSVAKGGDVAPADAETESAASEKLRSDAAAGQAREVANSQEVSHVG